MEKPLKNVRHERFAQGLAVGMTQADAYSAAGYKDKNPKSGASILINTNANVRARKEYLVRESVKAMIAAARGAVIKREELISNLYLIRAQAIQRDALDTARLCNNDLARLGGLYKDVEGHAGPITYQPDLGEHEDE